MHHDTFEERMMELALWLVLVGVALYWLGMAAFSGWATILAYRSAPRRRAEDISHLQLPLPPHAQSFGQVLADVGFHRLGETKIKLPLASFPRPTWVLVDHEGTTQAEIIAAGHAVALLFVTAFDDETFVETAFPWGEQIEEPSFCSRTVTSSTEEAYRYHRRQVAEWRAEHGTPQPIVDMTGFLRWDTLYRERYSRRKMQRAFWLGGVLPVAALGYALLAGALLLLLYRWENLTAEVLATRLSLLALLLAPAVALLAGLRIALSWGSRRGVQGEQTHESYPDRN